MSQSKPWYIFHPENPIPFEDGASQSWLDPKNMPPWRRNVNEEKIGVPPKLSKDEKLKGESYHLPPTRKSVDEALRLINIALLLRRPILVQGKPGIGKSSLAYHLSYILGLGSPLVWPINSQSTLQEGLYFYDAINHLRRTQDKTDDQHFEMGNFIRLGALGTALLNWDRPRVLLIDEIDKSNYDLPNDLLYTLEEGEFKIPELKQVEKDKAQIFTADNDNVKREILNGRVKMGFPPVIVMTSNNERNFPEAFLRRCIVLEFDIPEKEDMLKILYRHFDKEFTNEKIEEAFKTLEDENISAAPTDEILQAMFIGLNRGISVKEALESIKR